MSNETEDNDMDEDKAFAEAMDILTYLAYHADPENKELAAAAFDIMQQLQARDDNQQQQQQQQSPQMARQNQDWLRGHQAPKQMAAESTSPPQQQQRQTVQEQPKRPQQITPREFVSVVQRAVQKKRGVTFSTPVFKCLSDFDKCSGSHTRRLCLSLLVICVGRQVIPFLKA